jgi:hypothetical protein
MFWRNRWRGFKLAASRRHFGFAYAAKKVSSHQDRLETVRHISRPLFIQKGSSRPKLSGFAVAIDYAVEETGLFHDTGTRSFVQTRQESHGPRSSFGCSPGGIEHVMIRNIRPN